MPDIFNKPGPLTPCRIRMKFHAAVGADILKSINFPYPVEPMVRHHHENWNGTGYPDGFRVSRFPLAPGYCRLLTATMPSPRIAISAARQRQHAEQVLRERRGTWYDPWIVDVFLEILDRLEKEESEEVKVLKGRSRGSRAASSVEDHGTTAEEREFNEPRRELPLAASQEAAAEVRFPICGE